MLPNDGTEERIAIRGGLLACLADMKDMAVLIGRRLIQSGCFGCNVAATTVCEEVTWFETNDDGTRTLKKEMRKTRHWKRDTTTENSDPNLPENQAGVRG